MSRVPEGEVVGRDDELAVADAGHRETTATVASSVDSAADPDVR